jgi:glutamate 5-kinase
MKVPSGVKIEGKGDAKDYVLKIHRNIYGQKQAGRVWNKYLTNKLTKILGFKQSKVDECVYYRGKTLYVLYTDDSLLAGPDKKRYNKLSMS